MEKEFRNLAIRLRKQGKSYSEIAKKLSLAKSTLSYWLKDIRLSEKLRIKLQRRAAKAGTMALIKRNKLQTKIAIKRADTIQSDAIDEIEMVNLNELKLIGSALYLGEGGKTGNRVDFTNSDPVAIKSIMAFFRKICKVPESKFRLQLSIHNKNSVRIAENYWSKITKIPFSQFVKTNLTISKYSKNKRRKKLPFGTIQIRIADVKLFHRITGWIKGTIKQIDNMPG